MPGLRSAAALGNADWHLGAPLLAALATAWHTDIATVTEGIAAYSLGQGIALPLWGWFADRYGPGVSLRAGLLLATAASAGLALCPGPTWWVALRAAAGAGFATVTPSISLSYESLRPAQVRQRAFTMLTTATGASAIASPVLAEVALGCGSWRPAFAVIALLTIVTLFRVRITCPAPSGAGAETRPEAPAESSPAGTGSLPAHSHRAARATWSGYPTLIGLGIAEGMVMLGLPALLAPALAVTGGGTSATTVVVTYAAGVLGSTLLMRRRSRLWKPQTLLATGGALAAIGAFLAATLPGTAVLMLCAALLGTAWTYLHTTLQTWIPRLLPPAARARAASLFSASAILASSVTVALAASLLQKGLHSTVFAAGAALCALFTCWTVLLARRWM
ncbi:MFS transporter [Streptomyces axinellae]|uniref:Major facilitator superfamily (MFS) profile domain-containing protein n=1 Tax=Streptomyces axinellae TaxID=552788 RepID=A0ABP6CIP0_9ACTN